jgi:hypothetical protein
LFPVIGFSYDIPVGVNHDGLTAKIHFCFDSDPITHGNIEAILHRRDPQFPFKHLERFSFGIRSGYHDQLCAFQPARTNTFREMPVETDHDSHFADGCIVNLEPRISGGVIILLEETGRLNNMHHFRYPQ